MSTFRIIEVARTLHNLAMSSCYFRSRCGCWYPASVSWCYFQQYWWTDFHWDEHQTSPVSRVHQALQGAADGGGVVQEKPLQATERGTLTLTETFILCHRGVGCLHWWFVVWVGCVCQVASIHSSIHERWAQGFRTKHSIVMRWSMTVTSPVSSFNV